MISISGWGVVIKSSQYMSTIGIQGRFLLLGELFKRWEELYFLKAEELDC